MNYWMKTNHGVHLWQFEVISFKKQNAEGHKFQAKTQEFHSIGSRNS